MSVLSITFHTIPSEIEVWKKYILENLISLIENLMDVEKYVLSSVHSEMVSEGLNTNLLLFFDNENVRKEFIENELKNIQEHIEKKFSDSVMIFKTELNPIKSRF